jgi:hypothetical protein
MSIEPPDPDPFALDWQTLSILYGSESPHAQIARANRMKVDAHRVRSRMLGVDVPESDEELIIMLGGTSPMIGPSLPGLFSHAPMFPKPDPLDFIFGARLGGFDVNRSVDRTITVVHPPPWLRRLLDDGWRARAGLVPGLVRSCGGVLDEGRAASARYADQLPTNRKRKRERCKARRRASSGGR